MPQQKAKAKVSSEEALSALIAVDTHKHQDVTPIFFCCRQGIARFLLGNDFEDWTLA